MSIAVLLALLFGLGVAFLLDSLDNTVKSAKDVEEKLKRPLLGIVPLLKAQALGAASTIGKSDETRETDPRFAEAMRTIRTAISLDNLDKPHKIILITSSIGSEGKSLLALNLAAAFRGGEKTLLLDGDLRRPSVGKMLGLPRDAPGLSELVANHARLAECVIGTGVKDLDVVSAGFIPTDPLHNPVVVPHGHCAQGAGRQLFAHRHRLHAHIAGKRCGRTLKIRRLCALCRKIGHD